MDAAGLLSYAVSKRLQGHFVVDLLALLDDDTVLQLISGKADSGSAHLFAIHQDTALHDQAAGLAVGSGRPALTMRVRMPMEPSVRSASVS